MPIYEFRCESCGNVFEHLTLGSQDKFEAKCPECGADELSRVMSACASVVDSGSGAKGGKGIEVKSRSCHNAGSCTEITLPGHGD